MTEWLSSFQTQNCVYDVRWNLDAFDKLGHYPPCSSAGSCYSKRGEFKDSPLSLAAGFYHNIPTFVVLLKDLNDRIKARCWGFYFNNQFYLSNFYFAEGFRNLNALFVRAIEKASGIPLSFGKFSNESWSLPVYVNDHPIRCTPLSHPELKESSFPSFAEVTHCKVCARNLHGSKHVVCGFCVANGDEDEDEDEENYDGEY